MKYLPRFNLINLLPNGSQLTTPFGWDIGPKNGSMSIWPRIHHAVDRVGPGFISVPFDMTSSAFIEKDSQGCSEVRLFFNYGELRILHINKNEILTESLERLINNKPFLQGEKLGPCGNTGISIGNNDGRHIHYSFIIEKEYYDEDISNRFGEWWKKDDIPQLKEKYGQLFTNQVKQRAISMMNSYAIIKLDPFWKKEVIILNTEKVF